LILVGPAAEKQALNTTLLVCTESEALLTIIAEVAYLDLLD